MSRRRMWIGDGIRSSPALDPRDRGFTLGDGLFETIRAVRGRTPFLPLHLARLRAGADSIWLSLPWTDGFLTDAVAATLVANDLTDAAVRITVTRGVPAQRGLLPDAGAIPSLVVDAEPFGGSLHDLYARGATALTSRIRRDEHSPLCSLKSISRLDSILARRGAADAGADEAILCNTAGRIAGASAANIFIVNDRALRTPSVVEGALPGIVRGVLLHEVAPALGVAVEEGRVEADELGDAEEAFLTNALLGVLPLTLVDQRPIGGGRPGTVSVELSAAFARVMSE